MQTKIELQPRREQHLARWKQLGADPGLAKLPYKIETDRLGRIRPSWMRPDSILKCNKKKSYEKRT
jgi:hypothetical protein